MPANIKNQRQCGECTKCCEGWLQGNVHGHAMFPGRKCHFLGNACTIYKDRPQNPCRDYTCAWIEDHVFPEWMKPNLSNVIISEKVNEDNPNLTYYEVNEAGGKIDSSVLNWLIHWALREKKNIIYEIAGKQHVLGGNEFHQALETRNTKP